MITKHFIKIFIIILIIIIGLLILFTSKFLYKQKKSSFRVYYNKIDGDILEDMKDYDTNIVEASFFTKDDIEYLHKSDTKVIGYISLIEVGYWDTILIEKLFPTDYLIDENGERKMDLDNKNYLGNLSSSHFRKILLETIESRIIEKGMDGVFFDTLDWIDYFEYAKEDEFYNNLLNGYKLFLIEFKEKFPDKLIIQNRSFTSYYEISKKYIDVFFWENFNLYNENKAEVKKFNKFKRQVIWNKTNVDVISFENECFNKEVIDKVGWNFLYSEREHRYTDWNVEVR